MENDQGILSLIKKHKNLYIFTSPEGRALFSLLSIKDYYLVKRIAMEFPSLRLKLEEDIWNQCVIEQTFGAKVDNLPAGIVSTLAQIIMKKSCPTSLEKVGDDLDNARNKLRDMIQQLVLKVCEAFPSYTPEDVLKFDWDTLITRVAEAEKILGAELELNGKHIGKLTNTLDSSVQTINKDGIEIIDFEAMNKELAEG